MHQSLRIAKFGSYLVTFQDARRNRRVPISPKVSETRSIRDLPNTLDELPVELRRYSDKAVSGDSL